MRILIPEAHAIGPIACIRSLGRAGHYVIAMSTKADALGFSSRYCHQSILQPPTASPDTFPSWLEQLIAEHKIDLILPSEGLIALLGKSLEKFSRVLPAGPDVENLRRYMGKFELFEYFSNSAEQTLQENLPRTILLTSPVVEQNSLLDLQLPLFAKFDANPTRGLDSIVRKYNSHAEASEGLNALMSKYSRGIVQEFVPGRGVGVFFLRWNDQVVGSLMHRRLHEVPHTGGASSYRETWWDDALYADALRRIEAMRWWGVGMLEYRWNPEDGSFKLMEFNARFWGSLHLALFAEVDFPRLLVECWSGQEVASARGKSGVRCRMTFPKELEYLWSILRDGALSLSRKVGAIGEFCKLSLDPSIHSDLWFEGDRGLYWRALARTPKYFLGR